MFALLNLGMAAVAPSIAGMFYWLGVSDMLYLLPAFFFMFGTFNWFDETELMKKKVIWLAATTLASALVVISVVYVATTVATNATDNHIRGLAVLALFAALCVHIKFRRMYPADAER